MEAFRSKFNTFLRISLTFFVCLAALFAVGYTFFCIKSCYIKLFYCVVTFLAVLGVVLFIFRKKLSLNFAKNLIRKLSLTDILIIAAILRIMFVSIIPVTQTSDFKIMFIHAADVAQGNYSSFHDFNYFARFAHDTVTVLYFSLFYHLSETPQMIVEYFNVIFQLVAVFYMYKLTRFVFKNEFTAKTCTLLIAIFPAYIIYCGVTMSENMATPFFIASVYYFFKGLEAKKKYANIQFYLLSGALLSVANMFRMVGIVFLVAYIMYTLIYKGMKTSIKMAAPSIIAYALILIISSKALLYSGITEVDLWNSKEPNITSMLKGSNIEYFGMFNQEDASLPESLNYDKDAISRESKRIIIQRLTTSNPLRVLGLYISKLAVQWGIGDFAASEWIDKEINGPFDKNKYAVEAFEQLFYIFILILIYRNISKDKSKNEPIKFFYILLGGFILTYLMTEMQQRYAFIAVWVLLIIAGQNFEGFKLKSVLKKENTLQ